MMMDTDQITLVALGAFALGAAAAGLLTWAAAVLRRDRYYIRRIPKSDLQPRYSREEKQDGIA